ncbi:PF12158 family protein [Leptospira noguchii str. 2006001870]|uniref:DUF3592 domain-containing protein n=1 Tax=Leptospira noguchii TaxID=28182 RepID=UPI000297F082|nr:DUF3592 domain-containing protein [Leptospira noguchii]EKR75413.1 PF12158 family protein [Leptospira noguchii str. 2006001870]UOG33426.1 DUF3592 domain-containing protein [Leptospira noguchii]UOG44257.1 DUF3592 domain-containing protein [Leptospira noguchii]
MPAVLFFFVGIFIGSIVGLIVGKLKDFEWGIGIGCSIIGIFGLGVTTYVGIHQYYELKGMVKTKGTLVDYIEKSELSAESDTDNYYVTRYIPIIRFSTSDGKTYTIQDLGGSKKWEIKDNIDILYKPSDPEKGFIFIFQNTWGQTFALLFFSSVPLLIGFGFIGGKIWG